VSGGPDQELAAAVHARLAADGGVAALLGAPARIYDEPPPQPIFPYATLGEATSTPRDCAGGAGLEHGLTVHVYARYGGRPEALGVIAALRAALHDQPLTISGRRLVFLYATFADAFRLDQRTTHAVLRLKALTEAQ
jgi:Protein of unknown function (DUF3168)